VFQAVCLPQLCMRHLPGVKGVITSQRMHVSQALCSRWEEQRQAYQGRAVMRRRRRRGTSNFEQSLPPVLSSRSMPAEAVPRNEALELVAIITSHVYLLHVHSYGMCADPYCRYRGQRHSPAHGTDHKVTSLLCSRAHICCNAYPSQAAMQRACQSINLN